MSASTSISNSLETQDKELFIFNADKTQQIDRSRGDGRRHDFGRVLDEFRDRVYKRLHNLADDHRNILDSACTIIRITRPMLRMHVLQYVKGGDNVGGENEPMLLGNFVQFP